jgi:hypothetical protein
MITADEARRNKTGETVLDRVLAELDKKIQYHSKTETSITETIHSDLSSTVAEKLRELGFDVTVCIYREMEPWRKVVIDWGYYD